METALQQCNADRKRLSKEIGGARSRGEDSPRLEDRVRRIGDEIANSLGKRPKRKSGSAIYSSISQISRTPTRRSARPRPTTPSCAVGAKSRVDWPVLDHVALGRG